MHKASRAMTVKKAYFDVKICNPTAQSYRNSSMEAVYRSQERGKCRQYEERIREVELSSFTPPVFSIFEGMGKSTAVTYKHLADLISAKLFIQRNYKFCL